MTGDESSPVLTAVKRRKILRTLGVGTTVSTLGGWALTGRATAHDLEVVFPSCREVLIVVNDRNEFGVLGETISVFDADAGAVRSVDVELTPENTQLMQERFGDKPVFRHTVSGSDTIVAVETGDGRRVENPNDCPRPEPPAEAGAFALEQGDRCIPVTPLRFRDMPIEEFYGNPPDPKQSNTPTSLERPRTSLLFLYRGPSELTGPAGRDPNQVGLIFIHGASGGPGGAASFGLEGGPDPGPIVFDDDAAPNGDSLVCGGDGQCVANWAWDEANDGAVWHSLREEFAIRISPRFNEAAALDVPSGGGVERWQVLSGDARDPDRTDLALDQSVTLRSGTC